MGAPEVGVHDGAGRRVEDVADERRRATGLLPGVHRLEHEERRVDGVVLRRARRVREAVRDQAPVEVGEEPLEHLARELELPAGDGQPRQGDHGVPAPVGEPRVASDDGGRTVGPPDQVRVGRALQPGTSLAGRVRATYRPRSHHRPRARLGPQEQPGERPEVERCAGLDRRRDQLGPPRRELQLEAAGEQQVLAEVEPAIQLLEVLHVLMPFRRAGEGGAPVDEAERGQARVRLEADHARRAGASAPRTRSRRRGCGG